MEQSMIKNMLLSYMNEKLAELKDALAEKDLPKLKDVGHKIKGNSGSLAIGVTQINDLGRIIEQNGGEGMLEPCQEAYEKLVTIINEL